MSHPASVIHFVRALAGAHYLKMLQSKVETKIHGILRKIVLSPLQRASCASYRQFQENHVFFRNIYVRLIITSADWLG